MDTKQNEVKYFGRLTDEEKEWVRTKPFGRHNYAESVARIRDFSYIIELLQLNRTKMSLLDLACGPGWTSLMLSKMGLAVTGVDIAKDLIGVARENALKAGIRINFKVLDVEKINFKNQFDRVLIYDGLHHCPREKLVLKRAYQALKPGGMILVVEPNTAHGQDKIAQVAAARFGVLEKGFPPSYLIEEMEKIGYKNIIRYHCDYRLGKPMGPSIGQFLKQIIRLALFRFVWSNAKSQVWIRAEK